jgi:hypothetical protein
LSLSTRMYAISPGGTCDGSNDADADGSLESLGRTSAVPEASAPAEATGAFVVASRPPQPPMAKATMRAQRRTVCDAPPSVPGTRRRAFLSGSDLTAESLIIVTCAQSQGMAITLA